MFDTEEKAKNAGQNCRSRVSLTVSLIIRNDCGDELCYVVRRFCTHRFWTTIRGR